MSVSFDDMAVLWNPVTTAFVNPFTSDVIAETAGQKMFQTFFLHFLHPWRSDILATISISKINNKGVVVH